MKTNTENNPFLPKEEENTVPLPGGNFNDARASFDVDLTDVQTGYSIPDGDYVVKCVDVEQSVSNAGNPQFVWTFAIVGGNYDGREFRSYTALTPSAMWKVAETVTALGLGTAGQKIKFTRSEVLNRKCIATFEESEYKGKINSSITNVKPME